jgi:hypothetical protein
MAKQTIQHCPFLFRQIFAGEQYADRESSVNTQKTNQQASVRNTPGIEYLSPIFRPDLREHMIFDRQHFAQL